MSVFEEVKRSQCIFYPSVMTLQYGEKKTASNTYKDEMRFILNNTCDLFRFFVLLAPLYLSTVQLPANHTLAKEFDSLTIETEVEQSYFSERQKGVGRTVEEERQLVTTADMELEFSLNEAARFEFIYALEFDERISGEIETLLLNIDYTSFAYRIGRLENRFAHSATALSSNPFTEFAEVNADAVEIEAYPNDSLRIAAFGFEWKPENPGEDTKEDRREWGFDIGFDDEDKPFALRAGWISRLPAVDELSDFNPTDALTATIFIDLPGMYLLGEHVEALDKMTGFDDGEIRPRATSLEIGFRPRENVTLALRLDRANFLEDGPVTRYALYAERLIGEDALIAIEWTHAEFDPPAFEEDDVLDSSSTIEFVVKFGF